MPSKASVTGSTLMGSPSDCAGPTAARRFFLVHLERCQFVSQFGNLPTCGTRIRASLPAAPTPIPAAECPRDGHRDIPRRMRRRSGRSAWRLPHGCGGCRRCAWKVPVRLRRSAPRASVRRYRRPPRPDRSAHFPAAGFPPPAPKCERIDRHFLLRIGIHCGFLHYCLPPFAAVAVREVRAAGHVCRVPDNPVRFSRYTSGSEITPLSSR